MAKTRQEIEQRLASLGMHTPTGLPDLKANKPALPGFSSISLSKPEVAQPPSGFAKQFGYGMTSPIRVAGERLGFMDEAPSPTGVGGWIGNILGSLVGWGAATALTMATFGAGAVALSGAAAGSFAATAISAGASGALLGGYTGWGKDEGVDEVVKGAVLGAATDLAFLGAGKAFRSLKHAKMLKADTTKAVKMGLNPQEVLGQHNPNVLRKSLQTMPVETVDDVFAKTLKQAGRYGIKTPRAKNLGTKEKLRYLDEIVNNFEAYDRDVFKPLYRYSNDILMGKVSGEFRAGSAVKLGDIDNRYKQVLKLAPADETLKDWHEPGKRLMYQLRKVIRKEKAFGGGAFKSTTGSKAYNSLRKAAETATPEEIYSQFGKHARMAYMSPDDFMDFAKQINPNAEVDTDVVKSMVKEIKSKKGSKLATTVLDFSDGVVDGLNRAEAAKQSGIKGIPTLVAAPDVSHQAIDGIPFHTDPHQVPALLKRLGVDEKLVDTAVKKAAPVGEQKSLWDQLVMVNKDMRKYAAKKNNALEKQGVKSYKELNDRLLDMYTLMDDATGKEKTAIRSKIRSIKKSMSDWEYAVKQTETLDLRRQRLTPQIENMLQLDERGVLESAIGQALTPDPNAATAQYISYKPNVHQFLDKHGVSDFQNLDWHKPGVLDEWKALVKESKRQGVPLVDITEFDVLKPTEYEYMHGIIKKATPLPQEATLTTADVAHLEKPKSLLDMLPRRVLGEAPFRRIRRSKVQKDNFTHSYKKAVRDILGDKVKDTKFRENISRILENPEEFTKADAEAQGVAVKIRELFNILGKREFNVEGWQDNYVPHIMKSYRGGGRGFTPRNLKPGFKEARTGNMSEAVREMDILRIVDNYVEAGAREKFYQPVFDELDVVFGMRPRKDSKVPADLVKAAKGIKVHKSKVDYYQHMKDKLLGNPDYIEQELDNFLGKWIPDFGKKLLGLDKSGRYSAQISGFTAELAYSGTLGYNPFSAIKNLTQQISAVTNLSNNPLEGIDYWWKARKAMATKSGQAILKMNGVKAGRMPMEALDLQMLSMANVPGLGKLQKNAFKMFQWADQQNIDTSFMMKFLQERDLGYSVKEAVESAYGFTMSTQFMYGVDSPLMFKGALGKQLGLLMSWPLNFASLVREQGSQGEWVKAATMLASYAFGAEALSLTGLNFRSIHPVEVARGFLPFAMLEGEEQMSIPIRTAMAGFGMAKELAFGDPESQAQAWDKFKRTSRAYIPYSTQGRRILKTIEAARNELKIHERTLMSQITNSEEGKGREQYEMTTAEALFNLIGPTTNAYNRWQTLEDIGRSERTYRRLRAQAIDAFLNEDYDKFTDKMTELRVRFGGKVDIADIEQEIELREMNAIERRTSSIPQALRGHYLDE